MHPRLWVLLAVSALFPAGVAHSQDAAARHAAATNQLQRLAATMTAECLEDVPSLEAWEAKRPALRRQLAEMLGLDPLPPRTPLRAEITGTLVRDGFRIEKLVFESMPSLFVTGNFYVPDGLTSAAPTVLYLCGHSPHPLGAKSHYQNRTVWFATHGYCVLVLDTLEFGEVPGIHHGTHDLGRWSWLSLGYTPAGVEVWNAMRALDWLETRPESDTSRIGVTGISGGGAMTWFLAALDDRVAVAAPSCSTYTFGSQAEHWLARGQCDCIYYHNTYSWDFPIVAALIAPRPLLITSGQRDSIFPPDGYHDVFHRAKRVYDLFAGSSSDRIREVDADVGHSDPPEFLRASREWMNRWLQNDPRPLTDPASDADLPMETAEALACLSQPPVGAANDRVQDTFTAPAALNPPPDRNTWIQRRREVMSQLQDRVFRWLPTNAIPYETRTVSNRAGWGERYAHCREVNLQSEPGVRLLIQAFSPVAPTRAIPLVVVAKDAGETFYPMDFDEWLPLLGRCHLLVVRTRFSERTMSFGEYSDLERTSAWVGRTIAAMRVWDLRRVIHWALDEAHLQPSRTVVYGRGEMGVCAAYAALHEPRVDEVILSDPPVSHWVGPALLNVLRFTDFPEVAGALAPRQLTFVRAVPPGFEMTRTIYERMDAVDGFRVRGSLAEAVIDSTATPRERPK